jgi:hypothetical protein
MYFFNKDSHLCQGHYGLRSSYLCFLHSWDDRSATTSPSFYWLRRGPLNIDPPIPGLALKHDPPDHSLWVARIIGVKHLTWLPFNSWSLPGNSRKNVACPVATRESPWYTVEVSLLVTGSNYGELMVRVEAIPYAPNKHTFSASCLLGVFSNAGLTQHNVEPSPSFYSEICLEFRR